MNSNIVSSRQQIYDLLSSNNLVEYYSALIEQGGDDFNQLISCSDDEFMEICNLIGMTLKPLHVRRLKKAIDLIKNEQKITDTVDKPTFPSLYPNRNSSVPFEQKNSMSEQSEIKYNTSYNISPKHKTTFDSTIVSYSQTTSNDVNNNNGLSTTPTSSIYSSILSPHKSINETYNSNVQNIGSESNKFQINSLVSVGESTKETQKYVQNLSCPESESRIKALGIQLPDIPQLIKTEFMDSWRKDVIRNYAQIFGRDDTKRKTNRLSQTEELLNEVAFELCMRDPVLLLSRQRLLNAARQTLRDNGFGISPGALTTVVNSHKNAIETDRSSRKTNNTMLSVSLPKQMTSDDGSCDSSHSASPKPTCNETISSIDPSQINNMHSLLSNCKVLPEVPDPSNDYDLILIYKMFKRWPKNTLKTRKAFLRRKARLFEVVDGKLFYRNNENSCLREWLRDRQEQIKAIESCHIEVNGNHSFRERTLARVSVRFYWRSLTEDTYNYVDKCEICNEAIRQRMQLMSENSDSHVELKRNSVVKSSKSVKKPLKKILKVGQYPLDSNQPKSSYQVHEPAPIVQILPNDYYVYDGESSRYVIPDYNGSSFSESTNNFDSYGLNYEMQNQTIDSSNHLTDKNIDSSQLADKTNLCNDQNDSEDNYNDTANNNVDSNNVIDINSTSEYLARHDKPSIIVPIPSNLPSETSFENSNNRIVLSIKKMSNKNSSFENKTKYAVTDTKILVSD